MQATRTELRKRIRTTALAFAQRRYERDHPGAAPDASVAYALAHWREYVELALDFAAMSEALAEADAAPGN